MNSKAETVIASRAFQREAMRGEKIRIVGLLIVLAVVFLFVSGRAFIVGGPADIGLFLPVAALLAAMAVYETTMLVAVRRGIERDHTLPAWCWMVNVAIETLLPTIALLILTESEVYGPYRALAAPAVLAYFFFFILSILRLSPGMARMTGLVSTIGYLAVIAYTIVRYPDPPEGALSLGNGLYLTYAAFLLIGGFVAGEVARQVRRHVTAALDEALHNERVHRDLELARTIQQGLLPEKPPIAPGFDVAGWNQPADQTGGDFFLLGSSGRWTDGRRPRRRHRSRDWSGADCLGQPGLRTGLLRHGYGSRGCADSHRRTAQ